MFKKPLVGVLRGGPSSEYEVSLNSGKSVLKNLSDKWQGVDIFIDRDGFWHQGGVRRNPREIIKSVSVIFNAMHGEFGEDGQIQDILDSMGVPYTGSRAFASRIAMNKALAKSFLEKEGVLIPKHFIISESIWNQEIANRVFQDFVFPVIVKPLALGSSVGVYIVQNFYDLENILQQLFPISPEVLIEEYIKGREATGAVIDQWQDERYYPLPVIEIVPKNQSGFFDYDAKYNGQSEEICPGRFNEEESGEIRRLSVLVHKVLNLRHYSRSDFIIQPDGKIFFLETNTLPGLTEVSLVPKALQADGLSMSDFLDHILNLSLNNN